MKVLKNNKLLNYSQKQFLEFLHKKTIWSADWLNLKRNWQLAIKIHNIPKYTEEKTQAMYISRK